MTIALIILLGFILLVIWRRQGLFGFVVAVSGGVIYSLSERYAWNFFLALIGYILLLIGLVFLKRRVSRGSIGGAGQKGSHLDI
jgi:hypothetical protein